MATATPTLSSSQDASIATTITMIQPKPVIPPLRRHGLDGLRYVTRAFRAACSIAQSLDAAIKRGSVV
ncbi:hypothetical protein BCAR13_1640010 [Paraburkholderia caribensis]|nr:hypothetical protein BCAR13_1640010 [Paraburkholderia caribensis]